MCSYSTRAGDMGELQGYLVNQELSVLLTEVVTATNSHMAGRKYLPGYDVKNMGVLSYLCGALAGHARLGAHAVDGEVC